MKILLKELLENFKKIFVITLVIYLLTFIGLKFNVSFLKESSKALYGFFSIYSSLKLVFLAPLILSNLLFFTFYGIMESYCLMDSFYLLEILLKSVVLFSAQSIIFYIYMKFRIYYESNTKGKLKNKERFIKSFLLEKDNVKDYKHLVKISIIASVVFYLISIIIIPTLISNTSAGWIIKNINILTLAVVIVSAIVVGITNRVWTGQLFIGILLGLLLVYNGGRIYGFGMSGLLFPTYTGEMGFYYLIIYVMSSISQVGTRIILMFVKFMKFFKEYYSKGDLVR